MTFTELCEKLQSAVPERKDFSNATIAHALMIPQRATIEEWRKTNKVPEVYVEHVETMIKQWQEFFKSDKGTP